MSITPSPEDRIGARLDGKYLLRRICGQGGMGVLYEGEHVWTGRRVAVKLLHERRDRNGESLARFLKEARTAAALRHPNVVDILDMGADGTSPFLVMELLEGESLESLLSRAGRLSPTACLDILLPVLDAVAAAHAAGIVHRDLKPANIFLSRAHGAIVPKLVDFGIAEEAHTPGATKDLVLGTPAYMSPEQARGKPIGTETDVWALGVVLYRCLSGELPFSGDSPAMVLASVAEARPTPLVVRDPSLPPRFCAAVERALTGDPAGRYADTKEFARALVTTARVSGIDVPAHFGAPKSGTGSLDGITRSSTNSERASSAAGATTAELPLPETHVAENDSGASRMAVEGQKQPRASGLGPRLAFAAAFVGLGFLVQRLLAPPAAGVQDPSDTARAAAPRVSVATPVAIPAAPLPGPPAAAIAPGPAAPPRPAGSRPKLRPAPHPSRTEAPAAAASSALENGGRSVPKIRTEW